MYDVAVICSTIKERQELLERSARTWCKDAEASGLRVAVRVYGDGWGVENTHIAALEECYDIDSYSTMERSGGPLRGYNFWQRRVDADVYLFTHPEILFMPGTIATAYAHAHQHDNVFAPFKVFWVPQDMTARMDSLKLSELEDDDDLYDLDDVLKGDFYDNSEIRGIDRWESNTTYAVNANTAARLFPMPEFTEWGPDDPYLLMMRNELGIRNDTIMDPVLFHQWHERGVNDEARAVLLAREAMLRRGTPHTMP